MYLYEGLPCVLETKSGGARRPQEFTKPSFINWHDGFLLLGEGGGEEKKIVTRLN